MTAPEQIARDISHEHRNNYSTSGWSCDCGHKYPAFNHAREVEDHRLAEAARAGIQAAFEDRWRS